MTDFFGVVVTALIAFLAGWLSTRIQVSNQTKLAREAQRETRRTQRHEYMIWLMHQLVEARITYEGFLGESSIYSDELLKESPLVQRELAEAVGKAIAVCLASGDETLRVIAEDESIGLTPYLVEGFRTRNRDKFHEAVKRLGQIIQDLSGVGDSLEDRKKG